MNSGVTQTASRTYSTNGQKTIGVIAQNDQGAISSSATYTFSCNTNACPIGYTLQGTACIFSACPSGYELQGTQCVVSGQCTAFHTVKARISSTAVQMTSAAMRMGLLLRQMQWRSRTLGFNVGRTFARALGQDLHYLLDVAEHHLVHGHEQQSGQLDRPLVSRHALQSHLHPDHLHAPLHSFEGATPSSIEKSAIVNIAPTYEEMR